MDLMILIIMIVYSNALHKLELFYEKLGMPYIESFKQSMIKLNINERRISCSGYILLINYLLLKCFYSVFIKACKIYYKNVFDQYL